MGRLRSDEQMRHEALHDPLTGLANRALCRERLIHALARTGRDDGSACVLFIDLDDFKGVNDLYGHAAGDALLIALSAPAGARRCARRTPSRGSAATSSSSSARTSTSRPRSRSGIA